jgi:hypothetical protein
LIFFSLAPGVIYNFISPGEIFDWGDGENVEGEVIDKVTGDGENVEGEVIDKVTGDGAKFDGFFSCFIGVVPDDMLNRLV